MERSFCIYCKKTSNSLARHFCKDGVSISEAENRYLPFQTTSKEQDNRGQNSDYTNDVKNIETQKTIKQADMSNEINSSDQVTSRNNEETSFVQDSKVTGFHNNSVEISLESNRIGALAYVDLNNEMQRKNVALNACNNAKVQSYTNSEMVSGCNENINTVSQQKFDVDSITPTITSYNYISDGILIPTNCRQINKFREMEELLKGPLDEKTLNDYLEYIEFDWVGIYDKRISIVSKDSPPINEYLDRTNCGLEMRDKPNGETADDNSKLSTRYQKYGESKQKALIKSDLQSLTNNMACMELVPSQHIIDNSQPHVPPNFTSSIDKQESTYFCNNLRETRHDDNIIEMDNITSSMTEDEGLKISEPFLRNEENTAINTNNIPLTQMHGEYFKHAANTKEPLKEYFEEPTCNFDRLKNDTLRNLNPNCIQAVDSRTVLPKHGFSINHQIRSNRTYDGKSQHKRNTSSSKREIGLNEITFKRGKENPLNDASLSDYCLSRREKGTDTKNLKESQLNSSVKRSSADLKVLQNLSSRKLDSNVDILTHKEKKVHICDVCKKSFKHTSHFKDHVALHSDEKLFKCNVCEKTFKLKSYLKRHKKIHSEIFLCQFCKKPFTRQSDLEEHILIHSGGNLHVCEICGKPFSRPGHLRRHNLTHTGEKAHECNICGKKFSHKFNLKSHFKIHNRN